MILPILLPFRNRFFICLLVCPLLLFGQSTPCSNYQPALSSSGTCNEGGNVALKANTSSNGTIFWYEEASGGTALAKGDFFVTNIDRSNYFHASEQIKYTTTDSMLASEALTTYEGSTRGYYFRAPTDMNFSNIWVPTQASDAEQSVAILSFGDTPPGTFGRPSTDFEVLAFYKKREEPSIPLNLTIKQGTYIGILGGRGKKSSNSYGPIAPIVDLAGHAIPLYRLSMDGKLNRQKPRSLYAEKGQSIGRIQFTYSFEDTCTTERSTVLAPVLKPGPRYYAGDTICGSAKANLTAVPHSSHSEIAWYDDSSANAQLLARGRNFSPTVSSSSTFYVEERAIINRHFTQPGPETTVLTDTTKTRGFLFQAPNDFRITGAHVPTDAAKGVQNIAIVNFGDQPPSNDGGITNTFEVLALRQQASPTDTLALNLSIQKGDYIGVLGNRSDSSSLGLDHPVLLLNGDTARTQRLGMSERLATHEPQDLWTAPTGGIGRVQLLVEGYCVGTRKPVEVYVAPKPDALADPVNPTAPGARNGAIDVVVTGGTAPYDYYWSNGATTQDLQSLASGTYDLNIIDANGCSYFLSETLSGVDDVISLEGQPLRLFPNPTSRSSTLEIQGDFIPNDCRVRLLNGSGETIQQYAPADWNGQQLRIDLTGEANGTYFLRIEQDGEQQQMKLLKQ